MLFREGIDKISRAFPFISTLSDKKRALCTLTEKERESRLPERTEVEWIDETGRIIVDGVVNRDDHNREEEEKADVEAQLPERSLLDVADAAARAAARLRRAAEAEDAIEERFFFLPSRRERRREKKTEK